MKRRTMAWWLACLVGAGACIPAPPGGIADTGTGGDDEPPDPWTAVVDAPCDLDPETPSRIAVTTTDFATGGVTVLDLDPPAAHPDVALGSTDAIPFSPPSAEGQRLYVLHRFMWDYLDVLDPSAGFASVAEIPLSTGDGPSTNPHGLARAPDGRLFVSLFGSPAVAVVDPTRPPSQAWYDTVDLAPLADPDGNPEADVAVACGSTLVLFLSRLDRDRGFAPRGEDRIVAVDMEDGTILPGRIDLLGSFVKQVRRDPADPTGRTLLVLTTGIERVDLAAGEVQWAVSDAAFADAGIDHRYLPQSFDVDAEGRRAFLSAYAPDFSEVRLFSVDLRAPDAVPEPFAGGFDSVERTMELVGDTLYFGNTRGSQAGILRFDTSVDPPKLRGPAVPTGLPPYALTAMP